MSPRSARKRWMRSSSSRAWRFCSARATPSRPARASAKDFFTWKMICRRTSSNSWPVTRVAACALSIRRCRFPPSSMGWPTLKVYCVWLASLAPPNCSARKLAVGFGRRLAVISLAATDWRSNSLARTVGFALTARLTASSRDSRVSGPCATASPDAASMSMQTAPVAHQMFIHPLDRPTRVL